MGNKTAVEKTKDGLLASIADGTYKEGETIPTLKKLSEQFAVSINVVREAIKILEGMDILVSKRGSGIYIKNSYVPGQEPSTSEYVEYSFDEVLELAILIINSAIPTVIKNAPRESLYALRKEAESVLAACNLHPPQTTTKYVYEMHFTLKVIQLSNNSLALNTLTDLLSPWFDIDYQIVQFPEYKNLIVMDIKFIDALIARDIYRATLWTIERNRAYAKMTPPSLATRRYALKISAALSDT